MVAPLSKQNEAIEFATLSADSIKNLKVGFNTEFESKIKQFNHVCDKKDNMR